MKLLFMILIVILAIVVIILLLSDYIAYHSFPDYTKLQIKEFSWTGKDIISTPVFNSSTNTPPHNKSFTECSCCGESFFIDENSI